MNVTFPDDTKIYQYASVETVPDVFIVPENGDFVQALHDYDTEEWEYKPRSIYLKFKKNPPACALPETVPGFGCKPDDFIPLNFDWQWLWFDLLGLAAPTTTYAERLIAWASLTYQGRAFTDLHSVQRGFTDFVQGINIGSEKGPMAIKCLSTGGNIFKKLGNHGEYWIVEALDPTSPTPDVNDVFYKPWLVHWATEETVLRLPDTTWQVSPFPQLRPYGTPFPFVGIGGKNKIQKSRVKPIANGAKYSPYNPA